MMSFRKRKRWGILRETRTTQSVYGLVGSSQLCDTKLVNECSADIATRSSGYSARPLEISMTLRLHVSRRICANNVTLSASHRPAKSKCTKRSISQRDTSASINRQNQST